MATNFFLIRHGLTFWNHEHRYQGHTDIELNNEGIRQAQTLKKRFAMEKFDAIYSSDLKRALKTAEIINEIHQLPIQISSELREINFGVWEAHTYRELERDYPELLKIWLTKPELLHIPQGESFAMVRDRAVKLIRNIVLQYSNSTVAVITHGGTIAALICGLLGLSLDNIRKYKHNNAAVTLLTITQDKVILKLFNDLSHLENYS